MDIFLVILAILLIIFGIICIYYILFKFDEKKLRDVDFTPSTSQESIIATIIIFLVGLIFSILIGVLPTWFAKIIFFILALIPILIGVMMILQIFGYIQ
jgi:hypothetical protein